MAAGTLIVSAAWWLTATLNKRRIRRLASESRILSTPQGPVEYAEANAGYPILSFHGTPGGYDGALLAARLHCPPGYRLIGFSRPGYLRTPLASGRSAVSQADLASALLDALRLDRVVAYGLSGGGPAAVEFAIRHRSRCRALILAAAVTQREEPAKPAWQRPFEALLLTGFECVAWLLPVLAPGSLIAQISQVLTPFSIRKRGYLNDSMMFASLPRLALDRIESPVLILHGMKDGSVPFKTAEAASKRIPRCRSVFLKDAGHMNLMTKPEVKQAIAGFLAYLPV